MSRNKPVLSERDLGDYRIGAEIGKGSFADVYKGEYLAKGTPVAIKSVVKGNLNKKLLVNLESEISILKSMKHPHIVELLDYRQSESHFLLVMEYCALGDLSYFIRKREAISNSLPLVASLFERYPSPPGQGLHEDLVRHFLQQLASALRFLRDQNLVHRDIKPQNLLLCPPKKSQQEAVDAGYAGQWELPVLKLADFGFARMLPNTSLAETLCGSPLYMAPEILRYEKYNAKADLWSVGAVAYEMVTATPPFKAANHVELQRTIEKANDRIVFPPGNKSSPELRRLICALLKKAPTERIGFSEFFNDPVIVTNIAAENKPLDQSKLDDNLFISEYVRQSGIRDSNKNSRNNNSISPSSSSSTGRIDAPANIPSPPAAATSPSPSSSLLLHIENQGIASNSGTTRKTTTVSRPFTQPPRKYDKRKQEGASPPSEKPLDQEYVVVEKRTVEVNALADELAYSPSAPQRRRSSSSSPARAVIVAAAAAAAAAANPQGYPSTPTRLQRRMSIGYGASPTNALTKALGMASARLFGTKVDIYGQTKAISPPQFAQKSIPPSIDQEERRLIKDLESLATKAKVVNLFAEVKFSQLVPSPPVDMRSEAEPGADNLEPAIAAVVAEEALVLYVKTLSLLAKAMDLANQWWNATDAPVSNRLNDIVQWIREKFNESLDKAEIAQARLEGSAKAHGSSSTTTTNSNITAEKLIFDRALEMARAAAVNEIMGEDLQGCELSYGTAIWMLEALLEAEKAEDVLEDDDRAIVEKFITSIGLRLSVLRKKLESSKQESSTRQVNEIA